MKKWLPNEPANEQTMGEAMFLENNYWHRMSDAVANGINMVL
jgi:hypothetical protein